MFMIIIIQFMYERETKLVRVETGVISYLETKKETQYLTVPFVKCIRLTHFNAVKEMGYLVEHV